MTFSYEKPLSAEALARLLADAGPQACLLAGGTDLLVRLRARDLKTSVLVDVKAVDELSKIRQLADGSLWVGAAVSVNRVASDARVQSMFPGLAAAATAIGTFAIRNRATLVGNVANASPCADTVPVLSVLEAQVELRSTQGTRLVPMGEFIIGVKKTSRRAEEYVAAVHIPMQSETARTLFRKRQRVRGHDLALVNAALLHDPKRAKLRVAVGSCTPAPLLIVLDDQSDRPDPQEAARRAMDAISPISDVRASAEYRSDMTGVLVRKLVEDLKN